jgi:hypothetical protein
MILILNFVAVYFMYFKFRYKTIFKGAVPRDFLSLIKKKFFTDLIWFLALGRKVLCYLNYNFTEIFELFNVVLMSMIPDRKKFLARGL